MDGTKISPSVVTFLMLGGQRCGSTWVDKALRGHPQIFLPSSKQSYFFDQNYDKGLDWYLSRFDNVQKEQVAVGEIATGYCLPDALPKVIEAFPNIKIMLSVRDPSARAYSFYQSRSIKRDWKNIHEAIESDPGILERGKYIDQIETILAHYPKEQFLLNFFDDLHAHDEEYLRRILKFLDVETEWSSPAIGQVVQMAMFPRMRKQLRKFGLEPLVDQVSKSRVGDKIREFYKTNKVNRYKPIDQSTKQYLNEYYKDYNRRLEVYSGRDLSHWGK